MSSPNNDNIKKCYHISYFYIKVFIISLPKKLNACLISIILVIKLNQLFLKILFLINQNKNTYVRTRRKKYQFYKISSSSFSSHSNELPAWYSVTRVSKKFFSLFKSVSNIQAKGLLISFPFSSKY